MKKYFLLLLLIPWHGNSQEYADLFKIAYGQTFNNEFTDASGSTFIKSLEADFTLPVILSERNVLITGLAFSRNNLQLFPGSAFTNLYSTTGKFGLATKYNEKWSSTVVLLPKFASDYQHLSGDDFYFGGFAVLKLKKSEKLTYRFGVYATSEAFGMFTTPIIGAYYLSADNRFEMDLSLPISGDINYCLGVTTLGVDYYGIGRSFNITETDIPPVYVDLSSLEFAGYLQFNTLQKSVLLRIKLGYSSNNYEVYPQGEKIDLGLSAFSFGDDRTQLNPDLSGGVFLRFEAIYRFHFPSKDIETASEKNSEGN